MHVIKVDSNCYLVDWKYRDFLRIGRQFQEGMVVRLERVDRHGAEYVMVCTDAKQEKI